MACSADMYALMPVSITTANFRRYKKNVQTLSNPTIFGRINACGQRLRLVRRYPTQAEFDIDTNMDHPIKSELIALA